MACTIIGRTPEELRNILKNRGMWFKFEGAYTRDDILETLRIVQEGVSDPNDNQLYEVAGLEVKNRPSHLSQKDFERKIKARGKSPEDFKTADNLKGRDAGTKIHVVMQEVVNFLYNGIGNEAEIRNRAMRGPYAFTDTQFEAAKKAGLRLIRQITAIQEEINKQNGTEDKAVILTEQKLGDPTNDTVGAIDVLAVFSDNSAAIYDYKTVRLDSYSKLSKDILADYKIETYHRPMSEYKRILLKRHGVTKVRQSRLMPIRSTLKLKPKNQREPGNRLTEEFQIVEFMDSNEFLKQIPVASESTKYKGLNNLLEKQSSLIVDLENRLKRGGISSDRRTAIRGRIASLRKLIRNTIADLEISGLLIDVHNTMSYFQTLKNTPEFLEDGSRNPDAITLESIEDIISELSVYDSAIENLKEYLSEIPDREKLKEESTRVRNIVSSVRFYLEEAKEIRDQLILDEALDDSAKDEHGKLLAYNGLNGFQRRFLQTNEIQHPIFKAAKKLIDEAEWDTRTNYKEFAEEFEKILEPLYNWAKANGYSKQGVFDLFLNDSGNLHSKFSKEYYDKKRTAAKEGDIEFMKKYFEPKRENLKEYIKERRENYIKYLKARNNNLEDQVDSATGKVIKTGNQFRKEYEANLKQWDRENDIINYDSAWLNMQQYGPHHTMLRLKPELESEFYSEEYKRIKQTPELLAFYDYHIDKMYQFRDMMHILGETPINFVANVRKTLAEQIADSRGIARPIRELIDSLQIRGDDFFIGQTDPVTGEMKRSIPKLFTRPLENKDDKSHDLAKNLFLFGKAAYHYQHYSQVEAQILALKELLGSPSQVQGGEFTTSTTGQKIKGQIKDFFDRGARDVETYKLFSRFANFWLYGTRYDDKNFFGDSSKFNSTKVIAQLKNYFAMKSLAFAVIPGAGAFIAGKIASIIESKKGDSFTTPQFLRAQGRQIKQDKLSRKLADYFDTYSEDPGDRLATKFSARRLNKMFSTRSMFGPLRKADEVLNDVVLDAMTENYGINEEGQFIRLNRTGVNKKGAKSIRDIASLDNEGNLVLDLNKEQTIKFRNAVKATMSNIIGNMSNEEVALYDLSIGWSAAMQFKTWMPGLVRERFGKLRYDEHIQAVRQGRYNAYFSTYKPTTEELQNGFVLGYYMKEILLPNILKTSFDLVTFGLAPKLGVQRINERRARANYEVWRAKISETNPALANEVTYEEFIEAKQHQIKAFLVELRIILGAFALFTYLGGDDDHGDPRYMNNWLTRNMYKIFRKGNSELTFMWNPSEFARLIKNPIPMTRMLEDIYKTIGNTMDESRDLLFGENSVQDKAPFMYYTSQWMYGGTQIARVLELYKTYEKSPY